MNKLVIAVCVSVCVFVDKLRFINENIGNIEFYY